MSTKADRGLQETAGEHAPTHIDGAAVERVKSFKFLGVHIDNLKRSIHTAPLQPQEAEKM